MTLLVFTTAVVFWASALNVRYRDVQHLLNLGLLVWFWMTPIVYQGALVQSSLADKDIAGMSLWNLYLANPLTPIVLGFQRALYGDPVQDGEQVLPAVSLAWNAGILAVVLGGLDRAAVRDLAHCSSVCRATSRRNCDGRDRDHRHLQVLPLVPREAEQREAAAPGDARRRPRTSGRCGTCRSTCRRDRRSG